MTAARSVESPLPFKRPDLEAPLAVWEYAFALERMVVKLEDEVVRLRDRAVCSGCGSDVGESGVCTYEGCDDGDMIPASDLPFAVRRMREQRDEFHEELMLL